MKIGGNKKQNKRGFTLVELLIVIVVIAVLAAISVVAYNGIQQRSRDTIRRNDIAALQKALTMYKVDNGKFPTTTPNPGSSTWEISRDPGFMSALNMYTGGRSFNDPSPNRYYWYHEFAAGYGGCPAERGSFYVLMASNSLENPSGNVADTNEPGCMTHGWAANLHSNPKNLIRYGFVNG